MIFCTVSFFVVVLQIHTRRAHQFALTQPKKFKFDKCLFTCLFIHSSSEFSNLIFILSKFNNTKSSKKMCLIHVIYKTVFSFDQPVVLSFLDVLVTIKYCT